MATSTRRVERFILQSLLPILCSIIVGFAFSQFRVFDREYSAFQFFWSAVVASLFYHLLIYARSRDAILGLVILFFVTILTTGSNRPAFVLRDIFYVGAIGLNVFVYFKYFRQEHFHNYIYPAFTLAGIYGIIYIASCELLLGVIRNLAMESIARDVFSLASASAYFGVLIGFAVGAGIALNEKLTDVRRPQSIITAA